MNSSEPNLQPIYYTEASKSLIFLLALLAIIFSPIISVIHGTYFIHKASAYHYFPHEFDYNGLIWEIFVHSLVIWWIVKPFYMKKYSALSWRQILRASAYLFLAFAFLTIPAVMGILGSLLKITFVWGFQLFRTSEFVVNFFSLFLTSVVGMTICELINLRCGQVIKGKDIFYWFPKEFAVNTVIVSISLTFVLWQQGYIAGFSN